MAPHAAPLPKPFHTRRTVRHVPIEERVAVLETHAPTLATKADVKAEVRGAENRLILWILGAGVALAGFFFAQLSSNMARVDGAIAANTVRIDKLDAKIEQSVAKLDAKLDSRFDALMAEIRALRRDKE